MKRRSHEQLEEKIKEWLHYAPKPLQQEIYALQAKDPKALIERFETDVTFGTSGLRAPIGCGTAYINTLTVTKAARALSMYLTENYAAPVCVICFDNRKDSDLLAIAAARMLTSSGVKVLFCDTLRPVPYLSFCVRKAKATCGVMITASHNSEQYSGFKIYDESGAEMPPAVERQIETLMLSLDECHLSATADGKEGDIPRLCIDEYDAAYLDEIKALLMSYEEDVRSGSKIHIVYSALYGTGSTLAPRALAKCGFTKVTLVPEQCKSSSVFTGIKCPNPEDKRVYDRGLELLLREKGDVLFVNDADADRVGVALKVDGLPYIFSGNEIVSILFYYLCEKKNQKGLLNKSSFVIYSFVTTPLLGVIAQHYGIKALIVPTGFKYIGMALSTLEDKSLIMAAEESYGCLMGTYTCDKDGIAALCLLAELALMLKAEGRTLKDYLDDLYKMFGIFREKQESITFTEDTSGHEKISQMMQKLRNHPLTQVDGVKVVRHRDYLAGGIVGLDMRCDALSYELEDGSWLLIRPSGTEPKLRIHLGMRIVTEKIQEGIVLLDDKINTRVECVKTRLTCS